MLVKMVYLGRQREDLYKLKMLTHQDLDSTITSKNNWELISLESDRVSLSVKHRCFSVKRIGELRRPRNLKLVYQCRKRS